MGLPGVKKTLLIGDINLVINGRGPTLWVVFHPLYTANKQRPLVTEDPRFMAIVNRGPPPNVLTYPPSRNFRPYDQGL